MHGGVARIEVNGDAGLHGGVAIAAEGDDPVEEIRQFFRQRQRIPAKLIRGGWRLMERPAADETHGNFFIGLVGDGRTDAVGPGAAVGSAGRGKRSAAELLRIEAEGVRLRRILADRQRARRRFGGKFIAESGLIGKLQSHRFHLSQAPVQGTPLGFAHGLINLIETAYGKQQFVQLVHFYPRSQHFIQRKIMNGAMALDHVPAFAVGADEPAAVNLDFVLLADHAELDRVPE